MLEESTEQLCQLEVGKYFLNWTQKVQTIREKNNKLVFFNIKRLHCKNNKAIHRRGENIFNTRMQQRTHMQIIYNSYETVTKTKSADRKMGKILEQTIHKNKYTNY